MFRKLCVLKRAFSWVASAAVLSVDGRWTHFCVTLCWQRSCSAQGYPSRDLFVRLSGIGTWCWGSFWDSCRFESWLIFSRCRKHASFECSASGKVPCITVSRSLEKSDRATYAGGFVGLRVCRSWKGAHRKLQNILRHVNFHMLPLTYWQ